MNTDRHSREGGGSAPAVPDSVTSARPRLVRRIGAGLALVALAGGLWLAWRSGYIAELTDERLLEQRFETLGVWGPTALILAMALAIVFSPIPSGPIAMAAGAVFGPMPGTVYTVVGAVLGSAIAFSIARFFGYSAIRRWSKAEAVLDRLQQEHSQAWLMAAVFLSRLVPFISFDAVSYAAGLTPLSFWRFLLATVAGVVPISIVLAVSGAELVDADPATLAIVTVVVGTLTVLPLGIRWLVRRRRRR